MNSRLPVALAAMAALVLAACASSGGMVSRQGSAQSSRVTGTFKLDSRYMGVVEQTAQDRGVYVQWINPPRKRVQPALASAGP